VVAVLVFAGSAQAIVISFETSEGFPGGDGASFAGSATPAGTVDAWTPDVNTNVLIDKGPGGAGFGDEPLPLAGTNCPVQRQWR